MPGSDSSEEEGGSAAETTVEICAESAGVFDRVKCRLNRVMCKVLQKRAVVLKQQLELLDSSVWRTEELVRQVFELTDTDGYAQWMERREQLLRSVEVKRVGWLVKRRKVHVERELWRIGRQLVQMEERLDTVRQQVTDAEARVSRG